MIRNWYDEIPHPVLKTKREITKYIKIWLRLWPQRYSSSKVWMTHDDSGLLVYYKLPLWAFGSGELKKNLFYGNLSKRMRKLEQVPGGARIPPAGAIWIILPKYDIHTSNSLQDIRQTGPWNIGHADLQFMTHKSMSQGWAMSDQLSA